MHGSEESGRPDDRRPNIKICTYKRIYFAKVWFAPLQRQTLEALNIYIHESSVTQLTYDDIKRRLNVEDAVRNRLSHTMPDGWIGKGVPLS
jgi:hypothetical protein